MPVYEYTALDGRGKQVKGSIDAESIRAARQRLRQQNIFPTDIKEGHEAVQAKSKDVLRYLQSDRVPAKDLAVATRQLATLVEAGLPLVSALNALADQIDSPALKRITVSIREEVEEGISVAKALGKYPKVFPRLYINLVASGEASGNLEAVLANLADYLDAQLELQRKVASALLYPALMMVICSLVVFGLITVVVPKIVDIFRKQGAELPLPTKIMIFISDICSNYWWLILAFAALAIWGFRNYAKTPHGRARLDMLALRLPIYGRIYTKIATARVAKTLGTLLGSGVDLLIGLDITKNILSNVHLEAALENAKDGVREGRSLAAEISKSGLFPPMLSHMVAVGEKSGQLEHMLSKAGESYEAEVNATLAGLTSLLEPLLMIIVGTIVLAIIISVLLPMADLITVLQK